MYLAESNSLSQPQSQCAFVRGSRRRRSPDSPANAVVLAAPIYDFSDDDLPETPM
jgi:hypothetical protein